MPCDRAPKSSLAGATVVDTSGGRAEAPQWLGASQSYRGTRTGRRDTRVAREPERPCHFRRDCRLESRLTNSRLIHSYVPSWWGRTGDEPTVLPRQESFASLHILPRRASEGSEALPSLARRVRMSFFGARVISKRERDGCQQVTRFPGEQNSDQNGFFGSSCRRIHGEDRCGLPCPPRRIEFGPNHSC